MFFENGYTQFSTTDRENWSVFSWIIINIWYVENINLMSERPKVKQIWRHILFYTVFYLRLLVIYEWIIIILYQRSLSTREKVTFDG